MNYIFDIDGTLTPSRGKIDKEFEKFFLKWMKGKNVYFITGSDKDKTIEQIGKRIWKKATRCYQSCGNAVYQKDKLIHQLDFPLTKELDKLLNKFLEESEYSGTYTTNIEERIGLINFSTIGRDCPQDAREKYYKEEDERQGFCDEIMKQFPELEATVGGEISIDIYPKGKNKSQILDHVEGDITFFGDKCKEGGNDYPIVERLWNEFEEDFDSDKNLRPYIVYEVAHWTDTQQQLDIIENNHIDYRNLNKIENNKHTIHEHNG